MGNERKTEAIVRNHFQKFLDEIFLEEQVSEVSKIQNILSKASKSGSGKHGRPEFIIRFSDVSDLVCVIECKATTLQHQSQGVKKSTEFAVDGVLHYASHLSKGFDVLAIAASGDSEDFFKVSHFLHLKDQLEPTIIFGNELLPPSDYIKGYFNDPIKYRQDFESLHNFISKLNQRLHIDKVVEAERAILISALLISLDRRSFKDGYRTENNPQALARLVVESAIAQLGDAGVSGVRLEVLRQQFSFILTSPILSKKKHELREIIYETDNEVNSFIQNHKYLDVIGSLYIEFLRYANFAKGLGIVLTPPHITELFAELAEVNAKSVVYDNCTGTGGFLISAMKKMIADADGSTQQEEAIKANQLFGVELQPQIYPLAVSNMYIQQDGKTNIELGDCFDMAMIKKMKTNNPTIGFLNPPYKANKKTDTEELKFVFNNLECLQQGGKCVAIIPMQSALASNARITELKVKLMKHHTLDAVLSMPDELFFNSSVNVVSCIMVFTAHRPHPKNKKVFLGYFKDDGFVKRRIGGRCDALGRWNYVMNKWLNLYQNRITESGLSICVPLSGEEEWAPESYMETNFLNLTDEDFERTLHDYATYLFCERICSKVSDDTISQINADTHSLRNRKWGYVNLTDLFEIKGTKTTPLRELQLYKSGKLFPYITTSSSNNGVGGYFAHKTENGNVLTVDSAVAGYCSYQHWDFSASDHVEKLVPTFEMNSLLAMFLVTVINAEQYRYNYGRKCSQTRLKTSKIALPMVHDENIPDFNFMRSYIEQRRFSGNCQNL